MAECKPLPVRAYTGYLISKYKHETQLESYTMDCLREIVMTITKIAQEPKELLRYVDYISGKLQTKTKLDNRTGDEIVDDLIKML